MKTADFVWTQVGSIFVSYATAGTWTDESFARWQHETSTAAIDRYIAGIDGLLEMTARQRRIGAEIGIRRGIKTSIVCDNPVFRGVVTALSWLGADVTPFAWADVDSGARWLTASAEEQAAVVAAMAKLRDSVKAKNARTQHHHG